MSLVVESIQGVLRVQITAESRVIYTASISRINTASAESKVTCIVFDWVR